MANPIVIDMSHWQSDPIDWAALYDAGTIGIIHKATEGDSYVDDKLFERGNAAMNAGLLWSTYHFLRPGGMPLQMDHYLNTVQPVEGERVCLDHEDPEVSLDDLIDAVGYLWDCRPDLQITIYSGHVIKEQLGSQACPELEETSLWLAQYSSSPSWPSQVWSSWSLWQYSDTEQAVGVSGLVDGNQWNGTTDALIRWMSPATIEPIPSPVPIPVPPVIIIPKVLVNVQADPGVEVTVYVNGEPWSVG